MSHDWGQEALGPFALYVKNPVWIGEAAGETIVQEREQIVWSGSGPFEVPIYARRDGFIIFDFPSSSQLSGGAVPSCPIRPGERISEKVIKARKQRETLAYLRFQYMNSFLAGLYSGISTIQSTGTQVQEPINPTSFFGAENISGTWAVLRTSSVNIEYPLQRSSTLQVETVAHAAELMGRCVEVFGNAAVNLLSLLYLACHQYTLHQFSSAHLIAWSVTEMQLNHMWSETIRRADASNGGHTSVNRQRKDQLNGRDFTASVITQILSINGKLDDDLLARLDAARKKRNNFAHSLESVTADDAGAAIRTATDLMTKLADFRITSQLSYGFHL